MHTVGDGSRNRQAVEMLLPYLEKSMYQEAHLRALAFLRHPSLLEVSHQASMESLISCQSYFVKMDCVGALAVLARRQGDWPRVLAFWKQYVLPPMISDGRMLVGQVPNESKVSLQNYADAVTRHILDRQDFITEVSWILDQSSDFLHQVI
jgi:hypothetical protein